VGIVALLIGLQFGVIGLVLSLTIVSFVWTLTNMSYCGRLIGYKVFSQIKDISGLFVVGGAAFVLSELFRLQFSELSESLLLIILMSGLVYLGVYLSLIYIFDRPLLKMVLGALKNE
jgi:hypothetical protein